MADDVHYHNAPAAEASVREESLLAPYAFHSRETSGRRYAEPKHRYRVPFQRDRDRILHSAAFRRLSGKMQVFTGDMEDCDRTSSRKMEPAVISESCTSHRFRVR